MKIDIHYGVCNECYKEKHKKILAMQEVNHSYHQTMAELKLDTHCLYIEANNMYGESEAFMLCQRHLEPYLIRLREATAGRT